MPVTVHLLNESLWQRFHDATNEMIVSVKGRRIFPYLEFNISGLDEEGTYTVELHIKRSDTFRYRYDPESNQWTQWAQSDVEDWETVRLAYPVGGRFGLGISGRYLNSETISFYALKCTNSLDAIGPSKMYLPSRNCFYASLVLQKLENDEELEFDFPITSFIAVTMYCNPVIRRLKTESNYRACAARRLLEHKRSHSASPEEMEEQPREGTSGVKRERRDSDDDVQLVHEIPAPPLYGPSATIPVPAARSASSSPALILPERVYKRIRLIPNSGATVLQLVRQPSQEDEGIPAVNLMIESEPTPAAGETSKTPIQVRGIPGIRDYSSRKPNISNETVFASDVLKPVKGEDTTVKTTTRSCSNPIFQRRRCQEKIPLFKTEPIETEYC